MGVSSDVLVGQIKPASEAAQGMFLNKFFDPLSQAFAVRIVVVAACWTLAGGGRTLLTRAYALAIGLQQFSTPPPEFLAELQRLAPELKKEPLDVERELMDSLTDMIRARQRG